MLTSAVLLIAILTAGLASFQAISRFNDQSNRDYLISAGKLIGQQLTDAIPAGTAVDRALEVFSHDTKTLRATIVDTRGSVIFDNEADSSQMDNHLFRAEIALAIKGEGPGFAIRRSNTLGTEMIYVAQLIPDLDLVVRTSMPVKQQKGPARDMLLTIGLVLVLALAILFVLSALSTRWITRPRSRLEQSCQIHFRDATTPFACTSCARMTTRPPHWAKPFNTWPIACSNGHGLESARAARGRL
jgi:two-component system phosphate regulon sensor histidine kinase PhoR